MTTTLHMFQCLKLSWRTVGQKGKQLFRHLGGSDDPCVETGFFPGRDTRTHTDRQQERETVFLGLL